MGRSRAELSVLNSELAAVLLSRELNTCRAEMHTVSACSLCPVYTVAYLLSGRWEDAAHPTTMGRNGWEEMVALPASSDTTSLALGILLTAVNSVLTARRVRSDHAHGELAQRPRNTRTSTTDIVLTGAHERKELWSNTKLMQFVHSRVQVVYIAMPTMRGRNCQFCVTEREISSSKMQA